MKTITATATATTEKGTILNLTITSIRGWEEVTEKVWVDEYREVKNKKEIKKDEIIIEANGQKISGQFTTAISNEHKKQGLYAIFGGKIGLSEKVYNELKSVCDAAIREAETDADWLQYKALEKAAIEAEIQRIKDMEKIENMMTLNGRTY